MHNISSTRATIDAQPVPRVPVTSQTLLSIRTPQAPRISPDGKKVAFELWTREGNESIRKARIWVVDTAEGKAVPATRGKKNDTEHCWSPDSSQLAFISTGEGDKEKPQLHIMTIESGETRRICTMPNGVSNPAWSPDGRFISFLSQEGEEPKTDPHVVMPGRHTRLWCVRADYDTPEPITPDGITVWEYAWSPDSSQLALYYSTGPDETDWYRGQIGIVPAHGGAVQQVSQLTRQASGLTWSPDGTRLAYISGEWSDPGNGGGDISTLSLATRETRNLTPGIECSPGWCRWFPDGQRLLYCAWAGVTHQIGIIDDATGSITVVEKDFPIEAYASMLSATPDLHSFTATHSDSQHTSNVWLGRLIEEQGAPIGVKWQQLTDLNPIIDETIALAPCRRIRYPSVDNWEIDAIFTPPTTGSKDELPPLFVNVHGGPSWAWSEDLGMFYTQLLAAAGFAVLRPNIRGSWGRGVAFADAVIGDMGGKDFQDLLYGVDYLVQQRLVDGNRVAIGGWSNGGYLSAWAVTQTNRFKAAIMGAGISDWHNMHAQTNIADADMRLLQADPLREPEVYRRHSPLTYADRVTTPTLILHGENDPAVPVAQGYAFYRALRERNVPVEFVIYPREGHGLRERAHIQDADERVVRWLKQYV